MTSMKSTGLRPHPDRPRGSAADGGVAEAERFAPGGTRVFPDDGNNKSQFMQFAFGNSDISAVTLQIYRNTQYKQEMNRQG